MNHSKQTVIIGGGLAGLAAAYDLVQAGHQVTVLEAAPDFGGLASSLTIEGQPIERFYHFICRPDHHLIQLVNQLGLSHKLHWQQTRTSFYYNGRSYAFGTPFDLLTFSAIPWIQRIRFGLHIMASRYRDQWRWLDQIPAKPWLIENIGEDAYNVIWHPLLRVKFGLYDEKISAAWVWHRIWRVAQSRRHLWQRESFGYLEHGTATLVDPLVKWLQEHPAVTLRTGVRVQPLEIVDNQVHQIRVGEELISADYVISTVALPTLLKLVPGQSSSYFQKAQQVQYIGVVCALLNLKRPFSSNFWTNINDPRISFNGIIEQTNLNQNLQRAGLNLVYIPFYLPTNDSRYQAKDEALLAEYMAMLPLLNPQFQADWVKEWYIFRAPYAQAVCLTNFAELKPDHRTPIRGLYVTDSTQFYPEDRTISAAIEQGRKVAQMISGGE